MPQHSDTRYLPYTPEQVFDLVADVQSYDQFLPWCHGVRIHNQKENQFDADLIIGFKSFQETFTSRVKLTPKHRVEVEYIKGPMKYLKNVWEMTAKDDGCELNFEVDFEFKNPLLSVMIGAVFEEALRRMIGAFEKRAEETFG